MFWYAVIFLSPREGKFKQKNNQLFSWLKKEGKTEVSARLIDWPVDPVSASLGLWRFVLKEFDYKAQTKDSHIS